MQIPPTMTDQNEQLITDNFYLRTLITELRRDRDQALELIKGLQGDLESERSESAQLRTQLSEIRLDDLIADLRTTLDRLCLRRDGLIIQQDAPIERLLIASVETGDYFTAGIARTAMGERDDVSDEEIAECRAVCEALISASAVSR